MSKDTKKKPVMAVKVARTRAKRAAKEQALVLNKVDDTPGREDPNREAELTQAFFEGIQERFEIATEAISTELLNRKIVESDRIE